MLLSWILYSIANRATNSSINVAIAKLLSNDNTPKRDRDLLQYTYDASEHGHYPSPEYYASFISDDGKRYGGLSDTLMAIAQLEEFYNRSALERSLVAAINEGTTTEDLVASALTAIQSVSIAVSKSSEDRFRKTTYGEICEKPYEVGMMTGISDLDAVTNGLQRTCVGSICAFTGHGKTQTWISIMYKNAREGKKVVMISLEMAPELVYCMLEARYMSEEKGMNISSDDLIYRKLQGDDLARLKSFEGDYKRDVLDNLLVVDSSEFPQSVALNPTLICQLYTELEGMLGGLDMVIYDHVNQFNNLFPDLGNRVIKMVTDACVRWRSKEGIGLFTGFAVQCNRQGLTRASRNNGVYDILAISDLNEIERASTYCIFLYTDDDLKQQQETKVTMLKHRLGGVITEPIVTPFVPSISLVGSSVELMSYEDNFDPSSVMSGSVDFSGVDF